MTSEPTLWLGALQAALQTAQVMTLPVPAWVHAVVAIVLAFVGAVLTRARVRPVPVADPLPGGVTSPAAIITTK